MSPLQAILSKPHDEMTMSDYASVRSLSDADLCASLDSLILHELDCQRGKDSAALASSPDVCPYIIPNAFIYALDLYDPMLPQTTVLTVLRQSDDIVSFNLGDDYFTYALPLLWVHGNCQPEQLEAFLTEEGDNHRGKRIVFDLLGRLSCLAEENDIRERCRQVLRNVMHTYTGRIEAGQTVDRTDLSNLVTSSADAGIRDLESDITSLYASGNIDESICGDLDNTLFGLTHGACMDAPSTDSHHLFFAPPSPYRFT